MIKHGFFNARKLLNGDYDRKYNADDVNSYFKGTLSRDGIYSFVGNQCRVIPAGNMKVAVRDGKGQINYHWFEVTTNQTISIKSAHATLNRWTAIIARYDATNRNISLMAINGIAAENPEKPDMQKTDAIRDICLAYIYVAAGVTQITSNDITDTIENPELCGFVSSVLTGNNDIITVPQLPIASVSCQGHVYYLTEESVTSGKKYVKGYYYCEPSKTDYDYIDYDWMSDTLSNRPTAMEKYLNVLFYASDNHTWYRCVRTNVSTYQWQTVVVNTVNKLPEPTESINNNFYKLGDFIYKVEKQESNYKWYPFGVGSGGGGGGSGGFAIIRIEYPAGTEIQVTFNSDTTDAPDTSGTWIYGCDDAGTYTISIKNTSITKEVIITTEGQLENVYISAQVINYALIYYLGNEFSNPTDEEKKYAIKTGGWQSDGYKYIYNPYIFRCWATTAINIDAREFNYCFVKSTRNRYFNMAIGTGKNKTNTADTLNTPYIQKEAGLSTIFALSSLTSFGNNQISWGMGYYTTNGGAFNDATYSFDKETNHLSLKITNDNDSVKLYVAGFVKTDNISGLSTYGSTISAILSNATTLFEDESALNYMVQNCTGNFMISALQNSNFVNAMNASDNKSILLANEHWARFLALLDV